MNCAAGSFANERAGNFLEGETASTRSHFRIARKITHVDAAARSMSIEPALAVADAYVAAAGFNVDRTSAILDLDNSAAGFAVKCPFKMREVHPATAGMRIEITDDVADAYFATIRAQSQLRFFRNPNAVFGVCFLMIAASVVPDFAARANRDDVSVLADDNRSIGEIFFLFRFITEIDFAMRFESDFAVGAGGYVDCPKIDVDDQLPARRCIDFAR